MSRLNPFFIRSAVGIVKIGEESWKGDVLIPSSSGLLLESSASVVMPPGVGS